MGAEDDPGPVVGYTGARFGGTSRRKTRKREAAARVPSPEEAAREEAAREAARWDAVTEVFAVVRSATAQATADTSGNAEEPDEEPDGHDGHDEGPVVGYTGARFGGTPRRRTKPVALREPEPASVVPAPPSLPPLPGVEPEEQHFVPSGSSSVRPYVYTRGRTRSQFDLSIEALVSAVPTAPVGHMSGAHQAVGGLCREPRSMAEIAALLGVPLGVARVLVGDLAAAGAVSLHRTAGAAGPDLALMERVLSGLRRL